MLKNLLSLLLFSLSLSRASTNKRHIRVRNKSPSLITTYWVNPQTGEYIQQYEDDLFPGAGNNINSFVTHEFAVVEVLNGCSLPDGRRGGGKISKRKIKAKEGVGVCTESRFVVTDGEKQVIEVTGTEERFRAALIDDSVREYRSISRLLDDCFSTHKSCDAEKQPECERGGNWTEYEEAIKGCIIEGVKGEYEVMLNRISMEKSIRTAMAPMVENYTCANSDIATTTPARTEYWEYTRPNDGVGEHSRRVSVMFESSAAAVHVVDNFISKEECGEIERRTETKMRRASVASEDGGSKISANRKAMQAGLGVEWEREGKGDLTARLSRRVYEYTNEHSDLELNIDGQEDIMAIHYFGRGINDTEPDRYMPHCDGDCEGDSFRPGTRVATMVMYCSVPEVGGATNFAKSNIHVKPKVGQATWFKYVSELKVGEDGELHGVMDEGFSEHSGCPVIEGEKKIVTQWMRKGVSKEEPWDSFNTMGVSKKKVKELLEGGG